MEILAIVLSAVLFSLSAIHAYWAFGGKWPGASERELVNIVVGIGERMPPVVVTLAMAIALGLMAFIPLIASGLMDDGPLARLGLVTALPWLLAGVAAIFLLRGLLTLAAKFFPKVIAGRHERFVEMDARFYGPLCLVIGAAYLWFYLTLS